MEKANNHQERVSPLSIHGSIHESPSTSNNAPLGAQRLVISPELTNSSTSLEPVENIENENQSDPNSIIKLSKRRWLVLFGISVFGICMAVSADTSPILGLVLELLDLREDQYVYLGQVFYYVAAVTSIPTAWFVDKYGIKPSILMAATLYVFSCLLNLALYSYSFAGWQQYKMFYWFVGGFLGSQCAALFFMLPLKVAETWFSANERSLAWTIMVSTVEFGVCIVSLIYPRIMKTIPQIQILGYINIVTLIVTVIACLTCISTSAPKHPPSERQAKANQEKDISFQTAMKRLVTNKDIVVHLVHLGIFEACSRAVGSVFQKILTNAGQSTIFAGNLMSINAFVSIIMLIFMSSFVHKMENPILICKLSSTVQSVMQIVYMVFLLNHMPGWSLVVISILVTVTKCWAIPNFTNITADLAAGLVSQATIVGFSISLTVIVMTVINVTFGALIDFYGEGRDRVSDYFRPLVFVASVTAINEVVYQIFFQGRAAKRESNESTTTNSEQDLENNSHRLIG